MYWSDKWILKGLVRMTVMITSDAGSQLYIPGVYPVVSPSICMRHYVDLNLN